MLHEWIEPVIKKRAREISDEILDEGPYMIKINEIIYSGSLTQDTAFELENLLLQHTQDIIKKTYSLGLEEGAKYLK
ncbi:hypothetical protein ACU1JV_21765 [Paenibacillus sp. T2-29]